MKLPRLIFVTGKGGVGKTTSAAALALALSRHSPTVLIELDPRRATARTLAGEKGEASEDMSNLELQTVTARGELEAFVERLVPLKTISRRMLGSRTFGLVTAALPGLEAFLLLERLRLLAEPSASQRFVVVDAPATGGALELLAVASNVQGLAPAGSLHRLAEEVERFLRDHARFAVLLTLRAEELALRESLTAIKTLRTMGIRCLGALLNQVPPALFAAGELALIDRIEGHGSLAKARSRATASCAGARDKLRAEGLTVVDLPMLYRASIGPAELATLADELDELAAIA